MTSKALRIVTGEQNGLLADAKRIDASAVAAHRQSSVAASIAVFLEARSDVHDFKPSTTILAVTGAVGQIGDVMPAATAIFWPFPVS